MRSYQPVVAEAQRVKRSSWSFDKNDVRGEETHVERFALEELTDKVKRMIDNWSSKDNNEETQSQGHRVESYVPLNDVSSP